MFATLNSYGTILGNSTKLNLIQNASMPYTKAAVHNLLAGVHNTESSSKKSTTSNVEEVVILYDSTYIEIKSNAFVHGSLPVLGNTKLSGSMETQGDVIINKVSSHITMLAILE